MLLVLAAKYQNQNKELFLTLLFIFSAQTILMFLFQLCGIGGFDYPYVYLTIVFFSGNRHTRVVFFNMAITTVHHCQAGK